MQSLRTLLGCLLCLTGAACEHRTETSFDGATLTDASAVLAHGERLSHVLGCTGCHGPRLEGTPMTRGPGYGPLYASNLTIAAPRYSDAQLDDIIRKGIHPTRKALWRMPSEIFQNLSGSDFRALLAYLRTLKPAGKLLPPPMLGPNDRRDLALGRLKPAAAKVEEYRNSGPVDLGPTYALGRYITTVSCTECHGTTLRGDPSTKAPDLIVASVYSRAEFERLAMKGIALGNRKLDPMMYYVAIGRLAHMTVHERDALYSYLVARSRSQ